MRQLLEQSVPHVYRFALRLTGDPHRAEDLAQEVMLRAWRRRRDLRDPTALRSWILRITANVWNDELRRQQAHPAPAALETDLLESRTVSPATTNILKEEVQRTMQALDQLPSRQRSVVYLHVCEQLSLNEIAEILTISYTAAKASLSAGRQQLRTMLKDVCCDIDTVARKLN